MQNGKHHSSELFTRGPRNTVRHEFESWLPDDILPYKLASLAQRMGATLQRGATTQRVALKITGRGKRFRRDGSFPVDLRLTFQEKQGTDGIVYVVAELRPRAWFVSASRRRMWYRHIVRELHACLMKHNVPDAVFEVGYAASV